ncbi:signal recognition particle receptor subunit alpha [Candidatus Pacearchaeota archaeon]|nr:signal recognition particle receptor subunit alpha [Candidatus Pacearchaeota archaeon]
MLEKFGEVLRKATDKIANAIFLDKNLVDSIIKDLQRALIEADVNIKLVKELSDKLKKAAFDERIKGIEKKEHLIKVLHDELIALLGEYKQLKLQKGQNRILLLGLYGAGKCVHAESNIQLGNGDIIKIEDLYNRYKDKNEEELEEGKIIDISSKNLFVPSFNSNTAKIENKKVTHLWKLAKDNLIKIKVNNGNDFSVKVTPEHPFFVLRNEKIVKIRADEITLNDYISIPREIKNDGKIIGLFDEIKKLNLYTYLSQEEIKLILKEKNKNLKEICKDLKFKKNYCHFTSRIKRGQVPIELIEEGRFNLLRIKEYNSYKIITMPCYLTPEFAEFIGYVMGDGNIGKNYIQISNEDTEIIKRINELSKILFNITPSIKRDFRTKKMYKVIISSKSLIEVFKIFGLKRGRKGKELKIPQQILQSNKDTIRLFIRAYFDCDSSPSKGKRFIELISESNILIKQMDLLLRRFGILSAISKKIIKNISYWRLSIKARYAETYAGEIGYLINRKTKIIAGYKRIGIVQGTGNQDMIPLGKSLKELRTKLGFSIGEIQKNAVCSYGIHEKKGFISRENLLRLIVYYQIKKRGIFLSLLQDIENRSSLKDKYSKELINGTLYYLKDQGIINLEDNKNLILSQKGQLYLQQINENQSDYLLEMLEMLANSNVCWMPVKEIKNISNDKEFVYDLTVEDNHSFIAEGFIVHNTTTVAKLANYFAKRGNKSAVIGLDVHRPAAQEQLKQLAERNKLNYLIDINAKNPINTYKNFKPELSNYDVLIIDTAGRHSLDKELVAEISALNRLIEPTETILIMPADIGQAAKQQAQAFKEMLQISGIIVTRMDSTAKGGGALTACAEIKAPVYFITTGEKINDIEEFNPESFLSRLLGMGDLQILIEKVHSASDTKKQEEISKRLQEGQFSLEDVIEQVKTLGSVGGFDKIKSMIPGLGKVKLPELKVENQEQRIKKWEHIIKSMTQEEKNNPELLERQTTRIARIAKGSGTHTSDVRNLLKQYKMLKEVIKSGSTMGVGEGTLDQKQLIKLARKFGKKKFRM